MAEQQLTEDQLAILHQYKEILNESDDELARATLESLEWNLHNAIEANEMTGNSAVNPNAGRNVRDESVEIIQAPFPHCERMEVNDEMIYPPLNPTVKLEDEDSNEPIIIPSSKPYASSSKLKFKNEKAYGKKITPIVDELTLDSFTETKNGIGRNSRDDSGSGSTCSLSNHPAIQLASTSADVIVGGVASGSGTSKGSRKEKKRCKMSGADDNDPIQISFESEEDEDINDDIEMDDSSIVYLSDDDAKKEVPANATFTDQIPLIPTDFSSIIEAMQNFTTVFEARYGGNFAPFYQGSLSDALSEAFEAPGRNVMERRPLALYLHNDTSIATNIFAQTVMCSDHVSSLLKCQFVVWAWDMSQKENRQKLFEWLAASNMTDVSQSIKSIQTTMYPLLLVLVKDRPNIYPATVIRGHDGATQVVEKLMTGLDMYLRIKNKDVADEHSRLEREQIRQEQVEEYEKALATDRAKKEELAKLRQIEREEELKKQRTEEEKMIHEAKLASSLPSEPADAQHDVLTIRIRFPSGEQKTRRFRMTESLSWLVTYVESIGFDMDKHRIWTSDLPKKDVSTLDTSKSFAELNWPRREQVTVDEK